MIITLKNSLSAAFNKLRNSENDLSDDVIIEALARGLVKDNIFSISEIHCELCSKMSSDSCPHNLSLPEDRFCREFTLRKSVLGENN